MLSAITRIGPSLPICYDISETPKFHKDYNFHSGIILGDAHSKHIIIILVIDSWNFRELQESFAEILRGQKTEQKIEQSTYKNVEFQQDQHFEASEFHGLRVLEM